MYRWNTRRVPGGGGGGGGPVENGSRSRPHVQTPESEDIQTPKLRLADILNGCFSGPESRGPGPGYQNVKKNPIKVCMTLHILHHSAIQMHLDVTILIRKDLQL